MAGQVKLCFVFLLAFHFSLVSCRRDYHHYYSRYVTGESSTESSPFSATGISTSEPEHISTSDIYSSSNNDVQEWRHSTAIVLESYNRDVDDVRNIALVTWGASIGGLIFLGLIVFCIIICCPCCCRGQQRRGFIISSNVPAQPTTTLIQPQIRQVVAVQHYPPETQIPQYPPPYDTQPMQQHIQYPSTENLLQQNPMQQGGQHQFQQPTVDYNNPSTAPPPYPTKY